MVTWRQAKPPGNHVSSWWLKGKDPISGRTVTFGETRHKKVHARPHMWVAAAPSVAQRMAPLLRNFLASRLQALSQTNVFLFLYANKTRILRAFFMVSGTWTSAASPAAFAKHSAAATDIGSAAGTYSSL